MTKKFANRAKNNSKKRSLVFEPLEKRNLLTTFMVNTTADSGMGSLRQAILDANDTVNNPGHDDIQFNIAGGGFRTITLSSPLPSITDEVTINGATQPGFSGSPLIQINAGFAASGSSGLSLATNNSIVRGLEISRFGTGVNV